MQLKTLTQEQRIEARHNAINAVKLLMPDAPRRADYDGKQITKFPNWLSHFALVMSLGMFIVAFIPSSIRLWHIGSETFADALATDNYFTLAIVGVCAVLLAEFGAVLFTLAAALLDPTPKTRKILNGSVALSAFFALAGNYEVAILRASHVSVFTVLDAFLPTFLTLSTAFVLKEVILTKVAHHHAANMAYERAMTEWDKDNGNPELHRAFKQHYQTALRDMLVKVNSSGRGATERKAYMATLDNTAWSRLVYYEIKADDWYVDDMPAVPSVPFRSDVPSVPNIPNTAPAMGFANMTTTQNHQGVNSAGTTGTTGTFGNDDLTLAQQVLDAYPDLDMSDKGWHGRIVDVTGLSKGRATTRVLNAMQHLTNQPTDKE